MFAPPIAKTKSAELRRAIIEAQRPVQPAVSRIQQLQSRIGNQALSRFLARRASVAHNIEAAAPENTTGLPAGIQAKLKIGAVNDPLEEEADRVADQVMRMPDLDLSVTSAPPQVSRNCAACEEEDRKKLQMKPTGSEIADVEAPPIVHEVLRSPGQPLDSATRAFMEPRFGREFRDVRVHADLKAAESARAVNALAYTAGRDIVLGAKHYTPGTNEGRRLLAHELTHVVQQENMYTSDGITDRGSGSSSREHKAEAAADAVKSGGPIERVQVMDGVIQRRAAPYIKKITVHLAPPQSADLEWRGIAPAEATGSDHFTVSTGKGYSDPDDPRGTCTRKCCSDPMTQCAPPWNQPGRVGACCTYFGNNFWTDVPLEEHNGWKWWTPIQPYYSSRGIALHQHYEVTGEPIGHGCVRMDEPNAKRIFDYSNGRRTNVTIDGRAAPDLCDADRRCAPKERRGEGATRGETETGLDYARKTAEFQEAVPGLEGNMT